MPAQPSPTTTIHRVNLLIIINSSQNQKNPALNMMQLILRFGSSEIGHHYFAGFAPILTTLSTIAFSIPGAHLVGF